MSNKYSSVYKEGQTRGLDTNGVHPYDLNSYKQALDFQQYLRQQQRMSENETKLKDYKEIQQNQLFLAELDIQRRQKEFSLKKNIAKAYEMQKLNTKTKLSLERDREIQEEQARLRAVSSDLAQDYIKQQENKRILMFEQQEMLKLRQQQRENQKRQELLDKRKELEDLKRLENHKDIRDTLYNECYKLIQQQKPYIEEKKNGVNEWIDKHYHLQQKVLQQKEIIENNIRQNNIKMLNSGLKAQMEEKERKLNIHRQMKQKEAYDMNTKVERNLRDLRSLDLQKRNYQTLYRDELIKQSTTKSNGRDKKFSIFRTQVSPEKHNVEFQKPVRSLKRFEQLKTLIKNSKQMHSNRYINHL